MAVVARIIGYSLLTAGLGAVLGFGLFSLSEHGGKGASIVFACLGAIVGAVAGAAGEIVTAQRHIAEPKPQEQCLDSSGPSLSLSP